MALQNFVSKALPAISAAWLNVVDRLKFTVFEDSVTKAAARTALTNDAPLEVLNGGTGNRGTGTQFTDWLLSFFPFIYAYINPQTSDEVAGSVTPLNYKYNAVNVKRYAADGTAVDGTVDWTAAFVSAHAALPSTGGRITVPAGIYLISSTLVFTKKVLLIGEGYSESSSVTAATTLLKKSTLNGNLITLSGLSSLVMNLTVKGQGGNGGDGIQIAAGRCSIQNVGAFLMGGNGIRVGTDGSENCNIWSLFNIHSSSNGADGVYISSHTGPTLPDANGGTLCHLNASSNTGRGLHINNAQKNTFIGATVQTNTSYGVYLEQYALLNSFYGGDWDESNGTADLRLDTGAANNTFVGMGLTYAKITGATTTNFLFPNDKTLGVGTQLLFLTRQAANYLLATDAAGYINLVTGGRTQSDANSSLRLPADGTFGIGLGSSLFTSMLKGSTTWDPASIADGAVTSTTLTVTGAAIGDQVMVGFSNAVPALSFMVGSVTASNTVTVTLYNHTGGALDLASGTLRATVIKQ